MSRKILSADQIHQLDGGIAGKMIDHELLKIYQDITDRGHDGQKRKLVIELVFQEKNELANITLKCQAKLPASVGNTTKGRADLNSGGFIFRNDSIDNPEQTTFDDLEEKEKE